jgi:tetratricopeptide (TPR) repeat protein
MKSDCKDRHSRDRVASDLIFIGLEHEQSENWLAAADEYRKALTAEATAWNLRYSANNNLGYVLVQLGDYEQAATYCRAAIAIKPERYNAHKNLGLALQGQGLWSDAARCFIEATRISPMNARAWQHLEHLLLARPHLMEYDPELGQLVSDMRAALEEHGFIQPPIEPSPMYRPADIPSEH